MPKVTVDGGLSTGPLPEPEPEPVDQAAAGDQPEPVSQPEPVAGEAAAP